jgi:hypothetical protein
MATRALPNLFTHARSELAQDAVLAYLLEWADPRYRVCHPKMNALGEQYLREVISCSARATNIVGLADQEPITEVTVDTQIQGIDILVLVNRRLAVVIEDKVNTHEHSGQVARYRQVVSQLFSAAKSDILIHAVYLKTGNESPHRRPSPDLCGIMMREQVLAILNQHPEIEDQIILQFRQHLQALQTKTESYQILPPREWTRQAMEGFYNAICSWLIHLRETREIVRPLYPQWSYQPNQRGGEMVCAWGWADLVPRPVQGWLQLSDAQNLYFRIANISISSSKVKVSAQQMHELFRQVSHLATQPLWQGHINIQKAGRFIGGDSAAVALISFDSENRSWLPLNPQGLLDWSEACRRLRLAISFVESLRSTH